MVVQTRLFRKNGGRIIEEGGGCITSMSDTPHARQIQTKQQDREAAPAKTSIISSSYHPAITIYTAEVMRTEDIMRKDELCG